MNQIIFLTGCAGFIGQKTTEQLLEQGYTVIGIDNLNDYYDVRLKQHRLALLKARKGFSFHQIDIEDKQSVAKLFDQYPAISAVINLAARAGVRYSVENPYVYLSTNALGTLNLLELMQRRHIKKFVLASTSSLYAGQKLPFSEELPVNAPISPYAATKKAAEMLCYTYHFMYGIDVSVVRYFTVYGPAGRPDMSIFRFIKWIDAGIPITLYGDGTQSRDFTYIDDIAAGTVKALKPVGFEVINLGGGKSPCSMNEIIAQLELLLGKKARIDQKPFNKVDLTETQAAIGKAKCLLDWEPQIGIEEGLKRSVAWYQQNVHWLKDVVV